MGSTYEPVSPIAPIETQQWNQPMSGNGVPQYENGGERYGAHTRTDSAEQGLLLSPGQELPASDQCLATRTTEYLQPHEHQYLRDSFQSYQSIQYYGSNDGPTVYEFVTDNRYSSVGPYTNTTPYIPQNEPECQSYSAYDHFQPNNESIDESTNNHYPSERNYRYDSTYIIKQEYDQTPEQPNDHPRKGLSPWRWYATLAMSLLIAITSGYDLSNLANLQAPLYEAFGHVQLLPVVTIAYSAAVGAMVPLARRLAEFCDLRTILMVSAVLFAIGSAVCGASQDMNTVIVGRAIQGIGGAGLLQSGGGITAYFSTPAEISIIQALYGFFWVTGMTLGPVIGASFTQNEHTTWRWAFYVIIPLNVIIFVIALVATPSVKFPSNRSILSNLAGIDWLGVIIFDALVFMLGLSITFSGSTWPWNSSSAIVSWVFTSLLFVSFSVQQYFSVLTAPDKRIFPWEALSNRTVLLVCIAQGANAGPYGVTLYYTPLFFSFARGDTPTESSVHMLPFICSFIAVVLLTGLLLPILRRYAAFYAASALCAIAGSAYLVTIDPSIPDAYFMGATAVLGAGMAINWPVAITVNTHILQGRPDKGQDATNINFEMLSLPAVIVLSLAGCIYQNVGFNGLKEVLAPLGFDDDAIREALAGADSPVWSATQPDIRAAAVKSIVNTIAQNFYLVLAGGIVMLLAALFMKWEAPDFKGRNSATASKAETGCDSDNE